MSTCMVCSRALVAEEQPPEHWPTFGCCPDCRYIITSLVGWFRSVEKPDFKVLIDFTETVMERLPAEVQA